MVVVVDLLLLADHCFRCNFVGPSLYFLLCVRGCVRGCLRGCLCACSIRGILRGLPLQMSGVASSIGNSFATINDL